MTRRSTRESLTAQRVRYERDRRAELQALLDEIVAVTGYHRKAVIRTSDRDGRPASGRGPWAARAATAPRSRPPRRCVG